MRAFKYVYIHICTMLLRAVPLGVHGLVYKQVYTCIMYSRAVPLGAHGLE